MCTSPNAAGRSELTPPLPRPEAGTSGRRSSCPIDGFGRVERAPTLLTHYCTLRLSDSEYGELLVTASSIYIQHLPHCHTNILHKVVSLCLRECAQRSVLVAVTAASTWTTADWLSPVWPSMSPTQCRPHASRFAYTARIKYHE